MRVISQNNQIDVPYEMTSFHVSDNIVRMNMVGDTGKGSIMAVYSTPEKAVKTMQKLHECYMGAIFLHNVDFPKDVSEQLKSAKNGFICVNKRTDNVRIEPIHMVFRFPKEDEI